MNPRERVFAALNHQIPDHTPFFEVWIDGLFDELGVSDPYRAYAELGQDAILMPSQTPPGSNAWKDGVDEFGRVWKRGMYFSGMVASAEDLQRFTPPLSYASQFFDEKRIANLRKDYPDHCLFFGTHVGPFMGAYMAMGMERLFTLLKKDLPLVRAVLEARTDWCIALFKQVVDLGAEIIVMGDDSAHRHGPMISPQAWRELVLPCHQRVVRDLSVPVIWHSDGKMERLLPFAVEAGFAGVHGLEPLAGNRLGEIIARYAGQLALLGNVDINLFFQTNLELIRADVRRSYAQGGSGGYLLSSCNSIYPGMNPEAVREFFRYQSEFTERLT